MFTVNKMPKYIVYKSNQPISAVAIAVAVTPAIVVIVTILSYQCLPQPAVVSHRN